VEEFEHQPTHNLDCIQTDKSSSKQQNITVQTTTYIEGMILGEETQVPLGQPLRKNSFTALSHGSSTNLKLESHGEEHTLEYRIKAVGSHGEDEKPISLWHDVTLVHVDPVTDRPTPYLNFVCEIPKFSRSVFVLLYMFG
jgi:hypothetical protein